MNDKFENESDLVALSSSQVKLARGRITELAKQLGVSKSTVSRALSGSTQVSQETRRKIIAFLNQGNEPGNERDTAPTSKGNIAIISATDGGLQHFPHPFFLELIAAIGGELTPHGYGIQFANIPLWSDVAVKNFHEGSRAAGYIIIGQTRDLDRMERLAELLSPLVVWGGRSAKQTYCSVGSENMQPTKLAVQHLIKQGRRRIAFVGDRRYFETQRRFEGYKQALISANLPIDESLILDAAPFDPKSACTNITEIYNARQSFDALFSTSDLMAMSCISSLQQIGVSVPDDVAVVGYDDVQLSAFFNPPLTTIRQKIGIGAALLVEKLLLAIDGEKSESEILSADLIIRKSCGAVS
ncbi:MAG: LacI family DNA-binding transcriptional regulator [Alphaproteobacteria bacterium]|nr:LacI family DNA-binding transcriptional regulator [Alphaproteobacteria bacterium]